MCKEKKYVFCGLAEVQKSQKKIGGPQIANSQSATFAEDPQI